MLPPPTPKPQPTSPPAGGRERRRGGYNRGDARGMEEAAAGGRRTCPRQTAAPTHCNARVPTRVPRAAYRAPTAHGEALPLSGGCCQLGTCGRDRLPSRRARVKIGRQGQRPGSWGAGSGRRVAAAEKAAKARLGMGRKNPVNLADAPAPPHPYCPPRACGKLRVPTTPAPLASSPASMDATQRLERAFNPLRLLRPTRCGRPARRMATKGAKGAGRGPC